MSHEERLRTFVFPARRRHGRGGREDCDRRGGEDQRDREAEVNPYRHHKAPTHTRTNSQASEDADSLDGVSDKENTPQVPTQDVGPLLWAPTIQHGLGIERDIQHLQLATPATPPSSATPTTPLPHHSLAAHPPLTAPQISHLAPWYLVAAHHPGPPYAFPPTPQKHIRLRDARAGGSAAAHASDGDPRDLTSTLGAPDDGTHRVPPLRARRPPPLALTDPPGPPGPPGIYAHHHLPPPIPATPITQEHRNTPPNIPRRASVAGTGPANISLGPRRASVAVGEPRSAGLGPARKRRFAAGASAPWRRLTAEGGPGPVVRAPNSYPYPYPYAPPARRASLSAMSMLPSPFPVSPSAPGFSPLRRASLASPLALSASSPMSTTALVTPFSGSFPPPSAFSSFGSALPSGEKPICVSTLPSRPQTATYPAYPIPSSEENPFLVPHLPSRPQTATYPTYPLSSEEKLFPTPHLSNRPQTATHPTHPPKSAAHGVRFESFEGSQGQEAPPPSVPPTVGYAFPLVPWSGQPPVRSAGPDSGASVHAEPFASPALARRASMPLLVPHWDGQKGV